MRPYMQNNQSKRADGMAQTVEYKALSSNPRTSKTNKQTNKQTNKSSVETPPNNGRKCILLKRVWNII
jgi:hypothetical protein